MIKDQSLFPNSEKQILVNLNVFLVLVNKKKKKLWRNWEYQSINKLGGTIWLDLL